MILLVSTSRLLSFCSACIQSARAAGIDSAQTGVGIPVASRSSSKASKTRGTCRLVWKRGTDRYIADADPTWLDPTKVITDGTKRWVRNKILPELVVFMQGYVHPPRIECQACFPHNWMLLWSRIFADSPNCRTLNIVKT